MTLGVKGSSGLGVGQGNGSISLQPTYNPQARTVNPQGNNFNPQQPTTIPIQGTGSPGIHIGSPVPAASTYNPNNDALLKQINGLLAQLKAQANSFAPTIDWNGINAKASNAAASVVNPVYSKYLNDFIAQQGQAKQLQTEQTATNIQNLKDQLAATLSANTTTGERSAEDTAKTEGDINQAADYRQTDQGTAYGNERTALAVKQAGEGLTGSGLATKQAGTAEQTHLTTETRQAAADQEAKDTAELTKARTFEDLATSGKLATSAEGKGETQANFDLNKFIVGQGADLQNKQQELEVQRQAALATATQQQSGVLIRNWIQTIANPAQRQAAYQAYGAFI